MPWVYTAIILVLHIPVVIIRVVRWEAVQTWCLIATSFTVGTFSQSVLFHFLIDIWMFEPYLASSLPQRLPEDGNADTKFANSRDLTVLPFDRV